MKLSVLFLLVVPVWAGIGTPVLLDLTDRSTFTRTGNVVLAGVPLAEASAVTDVRTLAITTAPGGACAGGAQIDSHRLVTERWHGDPTDATKNIKWVVVAISAPTLGGSGVAHVCLADRVGADPGTAAVVTVNSSDTCADTTACTTVSTGINKYWIRHDSFNLFDQVRRISDNHDYVTHSTSGGIVAVTSAGRFTSATVPMATPGIPGYSISTEEPSGASTANEDGANLYAQIKVSGALWNGASPKFTYIGRLFFFGGDGMWLWKGTNIYSEDMFATANQPLSVGLFIPTTFGASLTATFGTAYGVPASSSAVSMANTDDVWLTQYDHGNTVSNTAPQIGSTTSQPAPWYVCNDIGAQNTASSATGENDCGGLNLSGFRIVKGTTTQSAGSQSDGWMGLDDGANQANVWMRDHWQNYPVEIEANGDTVAVYQWPKHGDTLVDGRANGDLTSIFNYKRDMALANQTGFGHIWPFSGGAAMNMTPVSPNPNRPFTTLVSAAAGQPVVLSAVGVNVQLTESACNGIGCKFWPVCTLTGGACTYDATKARKVFLNGFSGPWVSLNGYKMAMNTGTSTALGTTSYPNLAIFTDGGVPIDASGFGAPSAGCITNTAPYGTCTIGTIDSHTDAQTDSFGRAWEVAGNFTSHAGAAPGNDAARWRDTLLFTNPTYYCDTTLVMGHVHKQDIANFARADNEITNYFNSLYKRSLVENVFGIYYGLELYGAGPAGFGSRYFASLSRRRFDVGYWLQFMRTGDPVYFHRGQSELGAAEVETHHPPQVPVSSAYAGVGIDETGNTDSNPFWDTKHYVDVNNNFVVKHDGSPICTESTGGSVWFPIYNAPPSTLTPPGGSNVNACSDGQQPALDYATTAMRLDYDLTGNPRDKELLASTVKNVIFSATAGEGTGKIRTLTLDESSHLYDGGCFGRAFGGGMQSSVDAAEVLGNAPVNYIDLADRCFASNIQESSSGINVWTQNPTGILYDDAGIGTKSATPSLSGHAHYGSHYFATLWSYWSFPEYVSYKGNVSINAPAYAAGHAAVNVQTALNNMANGVLGYFNPTTKSGGFQPLMFPGRVASDSYALTGDAELLKYIKRNLDFFSAGADDVPTDTGCGQSGSASSVGDTPSVAPTGCTSPTASPPGSIPPFDLHSTTNPNAVSYSTPDIHSGGPLSIGLPYLEYPAGVLGAAKPDFPPTFVLVPAVGAANGPLTWITNCASCGGGFTFDILLRIAVGSDFGNLSIVTPVSGDFSLTVLNPSGTPVSGITVADSAGHSYIGSPTAVFKTPTQMWPPAAGGGLGGYQQYDSGGNPTTFFLCGAAPAPPSINYTADGLNNKDNRDFLVTVPAGANGEYKVQLTETNCNDPNGPQIPVASIASMSTGNVDLVTTTCTSCLGINTAPSYVGGVSGCTNARQVVTYIDGGGAGATGTVNIVGGVPSGSISLATPGTGYASVPAQATIATCTGTATLTGGALGPPISSFARGENGSIQYANVCGAGCKLQADSSLKFAVLSPSADQSGGLYRGLTIKTIPPATGGWAIMQNAGWQSESSFVLSHGGTGGIKPLLSPSPQTFYDSPNYSNQVFVSNINNPIALTFSGCAITTSSPLHSGTTGTLYSPTVQQTTSGCGTGTPAWSITGGTLPPGLSLSSAGVVSGTPTLRGTYSFTVSVAGLTSAPAPTAESITINDPTTCNRPTITSGSPLPTAATGTSYSYTFTAVGDPTITWSATGLPGWATLNAATGVLSGMPTAGTTAISVTATNGCGNSGPSAFTVTASAPASIQASTISASQVQ